MVYIMISYFSVFILRKIIKYGLLSKAIKIIKPFLSWRILVCYLPFWFVFTGWTYVALAIGNTWWKTASGVWLAWMWMPWCPEKLITIPLTIWLHKKLFPRHSTSELDSMLEKEKASVRGRNKKGE